MKLFEGVSIDRRSHWEMILLVIGNGDRVISNGASISNKRYRPIKTLKRFK